jgi:predicted nucleic acid-binding protein
MKIVFDTNVVLDVLGERVPFATASTEAMAVVEREGVVGAITANTITDLYFLLQKRKVDPSEIKDALMNRLDALEVLDTTKALCLLAFKSPVSDFEDAVLAESAKQWSADYIVTRNTGDFTNSPVKAIMPGEFLRLFS